MFKSIILSDQDIEWLVDHIKPGWGKTNRRYLDRIVATLQAVEVVESPAKPVSQETVSPRAQRRGPGRRPSPEGSIRHFVLDAFKGDELATASEIVDRLDGYINRNSARREVAKSAEMGFLYRSKQRINGSVLIAYQMAPKGRQLLGELGPISERS